MKAITPEYFMDMEQAMRQLTINGVFAYPFSFVTAMHATMRGIVGLLRRFPCRDEYSAASVAHNEFTEIGIGGPYMDFSVKDKILLAAREERVETEVATLVVRTAYRAKLDMNWLPPAGITEETPENFAAAMYERTLLGQQPELFTSRLVIPMLTSGMFLCYTGRKPNLAVYAVHQLLDYVRTLPLDEQWVRALFTGVMRNSFTEVFFHVGKYSDCGAADVEFQTIMQEKGLF